VRRQQHQGILVVGPGGEVAGIGGFDGAAVATPEVQLPADVEAGAVLPGTAVQLGVATVLVAVQVEGVGAGLLQLRVAPAAGDAELGAGLEDAQGGDAQVGVVDVRFGDQALEQRVVELRPPLPVVRLRVLLAGRVQRLAVPVVDPGLPR
jgi:hypothetical protein